MNNRTVHLESKPELALMLAHVGEGYLSDAIEIQRAGEPVAVLLAPEAARYALAIIPSTSHLCRVVAFYPRKEVEAYEASRRI